MATACANPCTEQIGETAGRIWHALSEAGPLSITKLVKIVGVPRDTVMQGLGWLAREDKIEIDETSRTKVVSLIETF
jgi:predicted ArsR family transcriptional regulator